MGSMTETMLNELKNQKKKDILKEQFSLFKM